MQDFARDIRLAGRSAFRSPGYALAVIATLAIGLGANTAIFGLGSLTLSATVIEIILVTLVASLVPAIRAARVDPVRSLRVDA